LVAAPRRVEDLLPVLPARSPTVALICASATFTGRAADL
jgi:hypothetical protein